MTSIRRCAANIILFSLSLLFTLIILEIAFRVVSVVKSQELIVKDDKLGWVLHNERKGFTRVNACGETVNFLPYPHKLLNKLPKYKNSRRILFIGDSYTHAHEVSSGAAYFDVFEEIVKDRYSVYVAGIGGYGTLQEYLLLNEVYDLVEPDIIVWQMCSNDINNNVFELDNSLIWNNQRPRPYYDLSSGKVEIRNPGFILFDISHGFRYVLGKLLILDSKYDLNVLSKLNFLIKLDASETEKYQKQGLLIIDELLKKTTKRYPGLKLYGFSVNKAHDEQFMEIFEKNEAIYFADFSEYMASHKNTDCLPLDFHWNHNGNKIAGERIAALILSSEKIN